MNRSEGVVRLEAAAVGDLRPANYLENVPRLLAAAPRALTTKELARQMWKYRRVPTAIAEKLRAALLQQPAFVEVAHIVWQLGRPALGAAGPGTPTG